MTAPAFQITFLGTSSGTPTLERSLACVAAQRGGELFLFDCGESAQVQYRRAGLGFAPLRALFITHLHGDHVTGLMGLLMTLGLADRTEPLDLYGPRGLEEYVECSRRALGTGWGYALRIRELPGPGTVFETAEYRVDAALLDHGVPCFGFAVTEAPRPGRFKLEAARAAGVPDGPLFGQLQRGETVTLPDGRTVIPEAVLGPPRPGTKVVYCTDTRPCAAAIDLARGADLLIYEGTFGPEVGREAHRKGHSTVVEAAQVAAAAGVRRLAITHLSPRYRDVRPLLDAARAVFAETLIARDLLALDVFHREA